MLYFIIFCYIRSVGNCLGPGTRGLSEVHWNKNCEVVCCIDIAGRNCTIDNVILVSRTEGSVDDEDVRPVSVVQLNCTLYQVRTHNPVLPTSASAKTAQFGPCQIRNGGMEDHSASSSEHCKEEELSVNLFQFVLIQSIMRSKTI